MADDSTFISMGRKAFPDAQNDISLLGVGRVFGEQFYTLGWAGKSRESFCLVNIDGPLSSLVGDHLRFRYGVSKSVYAYCVGIADVASDVIVTRRLFAALELLSVQQLSVIVEVIE